MKSYSEKLNSVIEILDREEDALIIELLKAKIDKIDKYYPLKTKDVQGAKNHSLSQLSLFLRKELYNINAYKKSNETKELKIDGFSRNSSNRRVNVYVLNDLK